MLRDPCGSASWCDGADFALALTRFVVKSRREGAEKCRGTSRSYYCVSIGSDSAWPVNRENIRPSCARSSHAILSRGLRGKFSAQCSHAQCERRDGRFYKRKLSARLQPSPSAGRGRQSRSATRPWI